MSIAGLGSAAVENKPGALFAEGSGSACEPCRQFDGYRVVSGILGMILLFAAIAKAYDPVLETPGRADWLSSPGTVLVAVVFEIGLGVGLLSGLYRREGWRIALLSFAVFAGISIYKGVSGATSCGCFGRLHTNPWHTASGDLVVIMALVLFRPPVAGAMYAKPSRVRLVSITSMVFVAAGLAAWLLVSRLPKALTTEDGFAIASPGSLVLLEPETWIGKPFGLARYIDVGGQLQTGQWLVILYHADCPVCQKAVSYLGGLAKSGRTRMALIEIPPHQPEARELIALHSGCLAGTLSKDREWFATTPAAILLDDNIVRGAAQGEDVLKIELDAQENRLIGL